MFKWFKPHLHDLYVGHPSEDFVSNSQSFQSFVGGLPFAHGTRVYLTQGVNEVLRHCRIGRITTKPA